MAKFLFSFNLEIRKEKKHNNTIFIFDMNARSARSPKPIRVCKSKIPITPQHVTATVYFYILILGLFIVNSYSFPRILYDCVDPNFREFHRKFSTFMSEINVDLLIIFFLLYKIKNVNFLCAYIIWNIILKDKWSIHIP